MSHRRGMLANRMWLRIAALALCLLAAAGSSRRSSHGLTLAGSTSVQPFAEQWAEAYEANHKGAGIHVQGGGSTTGIRAAITGAAQIGMASRELKPDEAAQLHRVVVAIDGLAVIVHPSNPVHGLTVEQVRGIFSGEIENWREVGGHDAPIHVVTREEGSGARGAFEELVMEKKRFVASALVQDSQGAVRQMVSSDRGAIGYISNGVVDPSVRALLVNGVAPSKETIIGKQYPLVRPFLFVTKGPPEGEAKAFIDWILGPNGQQLGLEMGIYPAS